MERTKERSSSLDRGGNVSQLATIPFSSTYHPHTRLLTLGELSCFFLFVFLVVCLQRWTGEDLGDFTDDQHNAIEEFRDFQNDFVPLSEIAADNSRTLRITQSKRAQGEAQAKEHADEAEKKRVKRVAAMEAYSV
jgi:hypothetical protein